ncbi:MAG: hypothetical protein C0401_10540 [Anaerolinea sp.]|nr:hypothetical protein [Anaerolinea sp.]
MEETYATFGSKELAESILKSIENFNACLLANHGLVTVSANIDAAFATAKVIELVSRLYYQARCIGDPMILSGNEMKMVIKKFSTYDNL